MTKLKPYLYQQKIIDRFMGKNKVGLFLDMGLGKTLICMELIVNNFVGGTVLILCKKGLIQGWREFIFSQYGEKSVILDNQEVSQLLGKIVIGNYEKARNRPELLKLRNVVLVLDEAQHVKNKNTKLSKFIRKICFIKIILLSGTPTGGKYDDLYNLFYFLGYEINYKTFCNQYCVFEKIPDTFRKKIVGYKNMSRLKNKLSNSSIFLKTNEVLELPKQNNNIIKVRKTIKLSEFENYRIVEIDNYEFVGDTNISYMINQLYLASTYNKYKNDYLKTLLESTNDRVIIFYNYNLELNKIIEICNKTNKKYNVLNGKNHDITDFKRNPDCVLIAHYKTGSEGYNFQYCNTIIYYSLTFSYTLFSQSKKRIHRLGQIKTCNYYYLITKNSIDEQIWFSLQNKKDYETKIFKGEKDEIRRF